MYWLTARIMHPARHPASTNAAHCSVLGHVHIDLQMVETILQSSMLVMGQYNFNPSLEREGEIEVTGEAGDFPFQGWQSTNFVHYGHNNDIRQTVKDVTPSNHLSNAIPRT
jgi:hypothetical protein